MVSSSITAAAETQEAVVFNNRTDRHGLFPLRQHGGLLVVWLVLLLECILVSSKKSLWFDEILTYRLAADRSFTHMYAALQDRFNVSPPVYHLLCWFWVRAAGSSALSLRLQTALCFCGAFGVLWAILKPKFGAAATTTALSCVLTAPMFINYNAEARNYGLYTLLCALALYQYDRRLSQKKFVMVSFLSNVLIHAGLVLTHLFGFLYGAAILLALFVEDIRQRRFRVDFYASVGLGWLLFFLIWGRTLRFQMGVFKPYSWVPLPHVYQLISVVALGPKYLLLLVSIAALGVLFLSLRRKRAVSLLGSAAHTSAWTPACFPLFLVAGTILFLPPIAAYIASYAITPVFVERYLLPGILAWAIFLTFAFSWLRYCFEAWKATAGAPAKSPLLDSGRLLGAFAVVPLVYALYAARTRPSVNTFQDSRRQAVEKERAETGLPVVCINDLDYLAVDFYSKNRSQFYFVLDESAALRSDPAAIGVEVVQYKVMSALRKYYDYPNVQEYDRFLANHDQFLVLLNLQNHWADIRLKSNPAYVCTPIALRDCDLLLVRKR